MEPKFAAKPTPAGPYVPGRTDLDRMPETPTRGAHHRRAHSETFFRFPDLDDILLDDVASNLNFDLPPNPTSLPNGLTAQPTWSNDSESRPVSHGFHFRSLSVDADFFEGLGFDGPAPSTEENNKVGQESGGPRHRHSNSMDGYGSATSVDEDSSAKKAMAADRLAELALIDPKRAKRILANRQSAARSKERKIRYTSELEKKVQTLQTEATKLSAQVTIVQRDSTGLTAENKELKLKLKALEQQAHLRDALSETLREELQRLKIAAGQIPSTNGNNRGLRPPFSSQPQAFNPFSNYQAQQQFQMPHSASNNPSLSMQHRPSYGDFNQGV
ncbi:transcription factor VIP1 [Olea europaea subsp. europaea]|uniref:Transcription factor VIP1 n=1 Tax=Olea europaea subsp. europaea TaxID=158383 RepID=A0A8S0UW28_OLEEU|nr:transcription factor VIP1 [Olea europaea subsp. europaea]